MKKVTLCLLVLLLVIVPVFAGGGKEAPNTTKKVVIMGEAHTVPEVQQAWSEVIADFTAKTGIVVEERRQGTWDQIPQRLQAAKLAREQVDLCVVGVGTIRSTLGPAGAVMDITDLMTGLEDRFPEGILGSCEIGGRIWAIPYQDGSGTTLFYNKTLFDKLGLSVPKTIDEMEAVAKVLSANGYIPLSFHGKDGWAWPMLFFDTYAQATGNTSVSQVEAFLKGEKTFTTASEKLALDALAELYDRKILGPEVFDTDENGMLAAFVQQKAGMIFCGTWDYPVLESMDVPFELAAMEFPQVIPGAKPQHAFAVGDGAIEIPSFADPANLENTMRFVEFLLRPENAKKILTAGGSPIFEVVKGAVSEETEVTKFLNEQSVPNSTIYLDWLWPSEINDEISQVIPAVISGRMTSAEAVDAIQKRYQTLVKEKDYTYAWWTTWTKEDWDKVTPQSIPDVASFASEY